MKELFVEHVIIDAYLKRRPLICTIELTTACNFRCVHCYVEGKNNPIFLPTEKAIAFIKTVVELGCMYIILTGGDPLLHPDFIKIYKFARSKCNVTVFTNGYTLNDKIINCFSSFKPSCIEVTIYGASEDTYEKTVMKRAFFKVLDSIEKLKQLDINLKIKAFFVKENFEDWEAIENIAENLNVPFQFDSFIIAPAESQEYLHQLSVNKQKILLKHYGRKAKNSYELGRLIGRESVDKIYKCGAGKYSVWLRANYTLNMCAFSPAQDSISLEVNTFADAWEKLGKMANSVIPSTIRCSSCPHVLNCLICPTKYMAIKGEHGMSPTQLCSLITKE